MKKISSGTPPPRSEDQRPRKQEQAEESIVFRNEEDNHNLSTANNKKAVGTANNGDDMIKLERKSTEDINESAEAFIQKFRQQLMIQRLESIENYEKMLARGL